MVLIDITVDPVSRRAVFFSIPSILTLASVGVPQSPADIFILCYVVAYLLMFRRATVFTLVYDPLREVDWLVFKALYWSGIFTHPLTIVN